MAFPTHQQYADLADDAYKNRIPSEDEINIGGNKYEVLAVANDRFSGYQGTVYRDLKTNAIIVAHRGTESPKKDWKDAVTDAAMVLNRDNGQAKAAVDLTKEAMRKIQEIHAQDPSKPMPTLTHTGHSLGGTLAQICAHYFDQPAVTYNAYGAASLPRIPEGGSRVVNYVKASDPVAAASGHYGSVVVLATPDEINRLSKAGYTNSRAANVLLPSTVYGAAATSVGSAHSIDNFTGRRSILSDPNARKLAQDNAVLIDAYRSDVNQERIGLNIILNAPDPIRNINNTIDMLKRDRPAGEPARKNLPPLTQIRPSENDMPQYAQTPPAFRLENMPRPIQNLYPKINDHLTAYHEKYGIPIDDEKKRNAAAALSVLAYSETMGRQQNVPLLFNIKDGQYLIGERNPGLIRTAMDMHVAAETPVEESISRMQEVAQQFQQREYERQLAQSQSRGMSIS